MSYKWDDPKVVIAVAFGDNDYTSTWFTVLNSIQYAVRTVMPKDNPFLTGDKPRVVQIINELVYGAYCVGQDPNQRHEEEYSRSVKDWLQIEEANIFLGAEEVDTYIQNEPWTNGETFILDMRLPPDQAIFAH